MSGSTHNIFECLKCHYKTLTEMHEEYKKYCKCGGLMKKIMEETIR